MKKILLHFGLLLSIVVAHAQITFTSQTTPTTATLKTISFADIFWEMNCTEPNFKAKPHY